MPIAAVLLFLAVVLNPGSTTAQTSERIYTAYGVSVDVRASTTREARAQAIAEAEYRGFRIILNKVLGADDVSRVPIPDERGLRSLTRGLEVNNERTSSTRYLAEFTITFKAQEVGNYLRSLNVEFSEIGANPVVLLPVYRVAGADILWPLGSGENAWAKAWEDAGHKNRLMEYVLAVGDLADQRTLPVHRALHSREGSELSAFYERYGVEDALVVTAERRQDGRNGRDEMYFSYRQGDVLYGEGRIQAGPEDDASTLLLRAAEAIMTRLDIRWRALTAIGTVEAVTLELKLPVERIAEWVSIRQKLDRIPIIEALEVNYLAVPESAISIRFVGGMDRLRLSLSQQSLSLVEKDRGWVLSETAPNIQSVDHEGELR